jgi:hypothetical protein
MPDFFAELGIECDNNKISNILFLFQISELPIGFFSQQK